MRDLDAATPEMQESLRGPSFPRGVPDGSGPTEYADPEEYAADLETLSGRLARAGRYGDASLCSTSAELIREQSEALYDARKEVA